MHRNSSKNRFTYTIFSRASIAGRPIVYVRFIDMETGEIIATRSTGIEAGKTPKATERAIKPRIAELLTELDLEAIAAARNRANEADLADDERLATMTILDFISWFWSDSSYYILERKDAGRPLSREYVDTSRSYIRTTINTFPDFSLTTVREARLSIMEAFIRKLRRAGKSRDVIKRNIDAIRTPLNWAQSRGLVEKPFDFKSIVLPEKTNRERGILSEEEIRQIVALPYAKPWNEKTGKVKITIDPRPRLKGKETYTEPPILDIRQKAAVLLALFAGLRRGEIRGLRWGDIDLANKRIDIKHNWVRFDGDKAPKKDSTGVLPLAPEIEDILGDLQILRDKLGYNRDDDFVLPGAKRDTAINEVALRRAWERALESIGIDEVARVARNLVFHGARHSYTTRLLDSGELSPAEVAKLTRHKDLSMLSRYGGHVQSETLEKGRKALSMKEENQHG
jgi:integrase